VNLSVNSFGQRKNQSQIIQKQFSNRNTIPSEKDSFIKKKNPQLSFSGGKSKILSNLGKEILEHIKLKKIAGILEKEEPAILKKPFITCMGYEPKIHGNPDGFIHEPIEPSKNLDWGKINKAREQGIESVVPDGKVEPNTFIKAETTTHNPTDVFGQKQTNIIEEAFGIPQEEAAHIARKQEFNQHLEPPHMPNPAEKSIAEQAESFFNPLSTDGMTPQTQESINHFTEGTGIGFSHNEEPAEITHQHIPNSTELFGNKQTNIIEEAFGMPQEEAAHIAGKQEFNQHLEPPNMPNHAEKTIAGQAEEFFNPLVSGTIDTETQDSLHHFTKGTGMGFSHNEEPSHIAPSNDKILDPLDNIVQTHSEIAPQENILGGGNEQMSDSDILPDILNG